MTRSSGAPSQPTGGGATRWEQIEEELRRQPRQRFSPLVWTGIVLLIVAVAGLGMFTFRDALGLFPPAASPTPRRVASPTPVASATPIPTPAPFAWLWVDCAPDDPCASELITRGEMARFLAGALELAPLTDADAFTDIADSEYRGEINAVAAAGLTAGCTADEFCPDGQVTREQMATFIQRALRLAQTTRDFYDDDEGSIHEAAINAIAAAGIAENCGSRLFCPDEFVTRGEVAGYLFRALGG